MDEFEEYLARTEKTIKYLYKLAHENGNFKLQLAIGNLKVGVEILRDEFDKIE